MLALLVAGLASIWTRRGCERIVKAFVLWFGVLKHPEDSRAPPEVVQIRLKACEGCVLFYARLRTCGTPLTRALRPYGCYCFMDEKAKLADAECYLDEYVEPGYPGGWEDTAARSAQRN